MGMPPVSTTANERPFHSTGSSMRSRVTPAVSSAMASRRPESRFTRVDFPTFGRPTTATTGNGPGGRPSPRPSSEASRSARSSGLSS